MRYFHPKKQEHAFYVGGECPKQASGREPRFGKLFLRAKLFPGDLLLIKRGFASHFRRCLAGGLMRFA
jgi:hypothetical protein